MKTIGSILLAAGLVFSPDLLHAQTVSVGSFNNDLGPVQTTQPDSIVQITAEAEGLSQVDPSALPFFASCWWTVFPGGGPVPMPCPPQDLSVPIYQIVDGIYLVDETGGAVSVSLPRTGATQAMTSSALASAVDRQGNAIANLIEQVQTTTANQQTRMMAQAMGMDVPSPGGGDGGGSYSPDALTNSFVAPDYGTNLWIAQTAVAAGYLNGIGTNTIADVQYEIQSRTNLVQSDWQSEGFINGSELTNWTPLSVPQSGRTNLFIRLKSWVSSDGSGIPDWWEALYGLTNVDPNALDSAGDGWTIYQKYELGVNPNTWVTPAAPQGVSATLHQPSKTASVSWLPARGAVTGYVVEKIDSGGTFGGYYPPTVTDVSLSAASTNYQDNISGNNRDLLNGNTYELAYRVKAVYGGNNSSWSTAIAAPVPTVAASVAPGTNGTTYLRVTGIPTNAVSVRLIFIDQFSYTNGVHDGEYDFTQNYPTSVFTNGLYQLTTPWPTTDGNGSADYLVFAESVAANGDESEPTWVVDSWTETPLAYNWGQPFYDARAQLKQNLIFQLRGAPMNTAFHFWLQGTNNNDPGTFGAQTGPYNFPTNYAYSGLYPFYSFAYTADVTSLDPYLPYEANALFRNFVYSSGDVDDSGFLTAC